MDMGKRFILALLATAAWVGPAPAQQAGGATGGSQAGGIETVYVTARKRTEDEQTVPISLDAYTQADLDKLSIKTIEDLKYVSPSVYVAATTFRQDTLNVTIRGQRDFDSSSGQSVMSFDTAAAVYMDGVYMARPVGLTGGLFDIDNIEVLKGPQGTLVGRNSTGGAGPRTTSREPTADYGGYVKLTGGDYGRGQLEARSISRIGRQFVLSRRRPGQRPEGLSRQLLFRSRHRLPQQPAGVGLQQDRRQFLAQMGGGRHAQHRAAGQHLGRARYRLVLSRSRLFPRQRPAQRQDGDLQHFPVCTCNNFTDMLGHFKVALLLHQCDPDHAPAA